MRSRDTRVRARVPLRVDPLERADRHALAVHTEERAVRELVAIDPELGEVRVVEDDERVQREQADPDRAHDRVVAGDAKHEYGDAGEREQRVRGPQDEEVRAHARHGRSLGARLAHRRDGQAPLDVRQRETDRGAAGPALVIFDQASLHSRPPGRRGLPR